MTGTTRIALDYDAIRSILIPVPPISVQRTIAESVKKRYAEAQQLRLKAQEVTDSAAKLLEDEMK